MTNKEMTSKQKLLTIEDIKNQVKENKKLVMESIQRSKEGSGEAPKEICSEILHKIGKELNPKKDFELSEIFTGTAILIQLGGTSPKQPDEKNIELGETKITLGLIRKICKQHGMTVRKFARGIAQDIGELMIELGEGAPEGNLAKYMRSEVPNLKWEEAVWVSDFQTFNRNCPETVRGWLAVDYRKRFRKN